MNPGTPGKQARGFLRLGLVLALSILLAVAAAASWTLLAVRSDPVPGFAARKGEIRHVQETARHALPDGEISEIVLSSSGGMQVQLALRRPHQPLAGNPVLVLIAGQETGRSAASMFPETHGITVAALSYRHAGRAKFSRLRVLLDLRKVQEAILDIAPAVMLVNDYLHEHLHPAPDTLELVGVSFGAFLAPVPAALDERIDRVWLIHGAAQPQRVIDRGLEGKIWPAPLRALVARYLAAAAAARYLAPEHWVGRIAPRPVIVINGTDDDDIPRESIRALHRSLGNPHEIIWVEGEHIHPERPETITRVIEQLFARMVTATQSPSRQR